MKRIEFWSNSGASARIGIAPKMISNASLQYELMSEATADSELLIVLDDTQFFIVQLRFPELCHK